MTPRFVISALACAICTALVHSPVSAQACLGQPGTRGIATFGLAGVDGASGVSFDAGVRAGSVFIGANYAQLDKFAQVDDIRSTGVRLAWRWTEGSTQLCLVGASEWTRYQDGPGWQSTADDHLVVGDYGRIRSPLGISVGREFGNVVSFTPFFTIAMVHDHEWMRWAEGGVTKRDTLEPGTSFGFATRFNRVVLRSQVNNAWTEHRALSDVNDNWSVFLHLGLAF